MSAGEPASEGGRYTEKEKSTARNGCATGQKKQNGRDAEALRPKLLNCEVLIAARRSDPANRNHAGLEGLDVRGLEALGSLGYLEFNRLAII